MLRSKFRLKSSNDFDQLYKDGKRFKGEYGMFLCKISPEGNTPRFGFVVSKKIGNAVVRHKLQRRLRHIVKEYMNDSGSCDKGSCDCNIGMKCSFIAFKNANSYHDLKVDVYKLLKDVEYHCKQFKR